MSLTGVGYQTRLNQILRIQNMQVENGLYLLWIYEIDEYYVKLNVSIL